LSELRLRPDRHEAHRHRRAGYFASAWSTASLVLIPGSSQFAARVSYVRVLQELKRLRQIVSESPT